MKLAESVKQVLKVSIAVFIATIINIFASLPLFHWLILSVFCVVSACRKAPLRHGFIVWVTMIAALFTATLLKNYNLWIFVLPPFLFLCASIYLLNHSLSFSIRLNIILFASVILIDILWREDVTQFTAQMTNLLLGGALSLILVYLVFPFRSYQAFSSGLTPTLQNLLNYSEDFTSTNKLHLQESVITYPYPNWVFESGFNPGLRGGYRFFLIHLEQIIDLYFILANGAPNQSLSADVFLQVQKHNSQLIMMLLNYFRHQVLPDTELDFTSDIAAMEKRAKKLMPASIEMLDLSPDYLSMQAYVQITKDIRKQLLQLLMSLPSPARAQ